MKTRLRQRERAFLEYTDPFKDKYPERWAALVASESGKAPVELGVPDDYEWWQD